MGKSLRSSFHTSARSALARWRGLRTVSTVTSATLAVVSIFFMSSPPLYGSFAWFTGVAIILASLSTVEVSIPNAIWTRKTICAHDKRDVVVKVGNTRILRHVISKKWKIAPAESSDLPTRMRRTVLRAVIQASKITLLVTEPQRWR